MLAKEKIWRAWLKGIIGLVAITGIVLLALFALSALGVSTKSPEAMIDGLAQYDVYVPLIIIVLMIISVIVVPIPGSVIAMAAGYMLGAALGTLYSYIGIILGSIIAYLIARYMGRPFTSRLFNIDKVNSFFKERGQVFMWLCFILPTFPSDVMCYISGLSKMEMKRFLLPLLLGYIPNVIFMSFFGSQIAESGASGKSTWYIVTAALLIVGSMVYFFYPKFKRQRQAAEDA